MSKFRALIKTQLKKLRLLLGAKPAVCRDISVWARKRNIKVIEIFPPILDEVIPFSTEDAQSKKVLDFHLEEYKRPQSLVVLSNARVRDEVGFVFLSDGSVCEQGNWFQPYLLEHAGYRAYSRRRASAEGDIFSLLGMFSEGFFHWFHDTLPRLLNSLPHLPEGVRFLIHSQPRPYQLESLKALGIAESRLIYQHEKCDMVCERLWFATPPGNSVFGGGSILRDLATRIKRYYAVETGDVVGRIYISRSKALRRVVNESEIIPILEEFDFKTILMEDLKFEDQVRICARANIIIGAHGAGLTNLMYCESNSIIGEIAPDDVFPFYLGMAKQMKCIYYRFSTEKTSDQNLIVDINKFRKWIIGLVVFGSPIK